MSELPASPETLPVIPENFLAPAALEKEWHALDTNKTLPDLFKVINAKGNPVLKNVSDEQGVTTRSTVLCVFKRSADGTLLAGTAIGNAAGPVGVEVYIDTEFSSALAALGGTGFVRIVEEKTDAAKMSLNTQLQELLDIAHKRLEVAGLGRRLDAEMIRKLREEIARGEEAHTSEGPKTESKAVSSVKEEKKKEPPITETPSAATPAPVAPAQSEALVYKNDESLHWSADPHARAVVAALLRKGVSYAVASDALENLGYRTAAGFPFRSSLIASVHRHFNGDPLAFANSLQKGLDTAAKEAAAAEALKIISEIKGTTTKSRRPRSEAHRAAIGMAARLHHAERRAQKEMHNKKTDAASREKQRTRRSADTAATERLWEAVLAEGEHYASDPKHAEEVDARFAAIVARLKGDYKIATPPFVFIITEGTRTPLYTSLPENELANIDAYLLNTAVIQIQITSAERVRNDKAGALKSIQRALAYRIAHELQALGKKEPSAFSTVLQNGIQRIQLAVDENLAKGAVFSKKVEYPGRIPWPASNSQV